MFVSGHHRLPRTISASDLRTPPVSLKLFMLQVEARALYREVLRSIKGMDAMTAAGVRQAARERFDEHAQETDAASARGAHLLVTQTHEC